ncbi:exo-alpha-sialidase [Streptomyces sp. WMMC500]|uniref:sialidase family protein n=1 Tax=Streptomyces sp. WMMC500 TaxID=3015154 RepID=UPI00248CB89E|nr:sialidase family protein [Streptomyces sp. WMMC500]WBB61930.1 exo-alpha-sialidase [Streptomyces sp. WMMC500]
MTAASHRTPRFRRRVLRLSGALLVALGGLSVYLARPGAESAGAAPAATVDPFEAQTTTLFTASGPGCYRIPAVVRTASGSLLAFAEQRVNSCEDKSNIRLVSRRLPAGSGTWESRKTVAEGTDADADAPATRGNAAPVVYRTLDGAPATGQPDGRIVLLSTFNPVDPAAPGETNSGAPRTPYVQYSTDDGQSWTRPKSLYEQIDDPEWGHYATGPVHAVQLTRGEHVGRLMAGVNYNFRDDSGTPVYGAMIVYSDDGGTTWREGARRTYPSDSSTIQPQELSLVELANGDVYVWTRQNHFRDDGNDADVTARPHRLAAVSKDGGASFTAAGFQPVEGYEAPRAQSAVLRMDATDEGNPYNRILTSAPAWNNSRRAMTVRSSFDETATWQGVDTVASDSTDEGVQVWGSKNRGLPKDECACYAGYSDLVELPDGDIGLLYERGSTSVYEEIAFVRLEPDDLPAPATTPDTARSADALAFDGTRRTVDGRFGNGLVFDGQTGRVQLPYAPEPLLGTGDFTVSTWIKYGDKRTGQAVFWANGMNDAPQLWLRAEPDDGRLLARLNDATDPAVSVTTSRAYADNAWHHVVLRRSGDTLTVFVDGTEAGSATGAAGDVMGSDPAPVHLGQRMDGAQRFQGTMDEFRIYDRALTAAEITSLRDTNETSGTELVAHLPLGTLS